jgi:hypothetical protein
VADWGTRLLSLRSSTRKFVPEPEPNMRCMIAAAAYSLIISTSVASAQVGGGGSSSSGGAGATAGRGGGGGALSPGATAPAVPSVGTPGPINPDPQRNNVDVNPPGQRLPGPAPSMSPPTPNIGTPDNPGQSFTPPPGRAQPGAAVSTRPGAAQSANSDGYAECMALWSPSNAGMSRQEWSKTCDQTRLPPKK